MLYNVGHEELADTKAMAENYGPHELVKVKREDNDGIGATDDRPDGTTESTEYVPAD